MARFNIFKGSRRIALLAQFLWVVGVAIFMWTESSSNVSLNFITDSPGQAFRMVVTDDCNIGTDATEFITRDIGDGKMARVELCFKAVRADSGKQFVPYRADPNGTLWGNDRYSSEVMAYSEARAAAFALNDVDQQAAREEWDRQWWKNIRNAILIAIGGLIAISLLQAVIGWIVRGFMDIPWGQDHRPKAPDKLNVSG